MPRTNFLPFLLIAAVPAIASTSPKLADAPAFSISAKDVLAEAAQEAATSGSPAVILVDDEHWTVRSNGDVERVQHLVMKIISASAVQNFSGVQERWEPWHMKRPEIRARVITADGISHDLDPKTLVDAPAGGNTQQTYSDVRVIQGPLPAVEAGAVVEEQMTEVTTPILGSMAFRGYVAGAVPVRFSRMSADYPDSLPFRYTVDLCPEFKESKETKDGRVHLTLIFGGFEPVETVDPLLPFDAPRMPSITLSTGNSWQEIAAQYDQVVNRQIADAPPNEFVSKAIGTDQDRQARIASLVAALHRNVRYTGVEFADAAIIPAKPAETIGRKYGDCKDKASLLVAMLRSAGIPAYVALLNAGVDQDVSPKHPGMGMFNHAIVYVPRANLSAGDSPDLWIDATAEYMQVGLIPSMDQGRLALIARPETTELVRVPEAGPEVNQTLTVRTIKLPDYGPSRVTESMSGTGEFDSAFRTLFQFLDTEQFRKQFDKRIQGEWDTKSAISIDHPVVTDLKKKFHLDMDIPNAKNVLVSETGLSVTLPVLQVLEAFPQVFWLDPKEAEKDKNQKKDRTQGYVLPNAFVANASYRIQMPEGFDLKKLPEPQNIVLGPARFTSTYQRNGQTIEADISFTTGKRNYTLEEGRALNQALLELAKTPLPILEMEPRGQLLLEAGKLREGVDAFRTVTEQHTAEAMNHVRLSRAYLLASCGREARQEARLAAETAPSMAVVWRNYAFVLEHDLIGRRFRSGWDPAGAETALKKAMAIDTDDPSIPGELAETLEYNEWGERYASVARLQSAVEVLSKMGDKLDPFSTGDRLVYDLAYLGKFDELVTKIDKFGSDETKLALRLVAGMVKDGSEKALADLRSAPGADQVKTAAEQDAFHVLLALKKYPEASAALAASLQGNSDNSQAAQANLYSTVTQHDVTELKPDSPEHVATLFSLWSTRREQTEADLNGMLAKEADTREFLASMRIERLYTTIPVLRNNISRSAIVDWWISNSKLSVQQNGESGYRVRVSQPGRTISIYAVPDGAGFKIVGTSSLVSGLGRKALEELDAGHAEIARKWLDWAREEVKLANEDDALGGMPFAHLWTRGSKVDATRIRYAAAALAADAQGLPILAKGSQSVDDPMQRAYLKTAFVMVANHEKKYSESLPVVRQLAADFPDSDSAVNLLAFTLGALDQAPEAERVLRAQIEKNAEEIAPRRALARMLLLAGKGAEAVQAARECAQAPGATGNDWNQYGWYALVAGKVDAALVEAVERGQPQPSPAARHTIAAMYADIGKLQEARQTAAQLIDPMFEIPNEWWYVMGRIAEGVGAFQSASDYYNRVQQGPFEDAGSDSTFALAQKRLPLVRGKI